MTRKTTASLLVLAAAMAATPAAAQDADVSVSVTVDYVSEYVFRGVSFESEAVQPGVEVAVGNFAAGVWASTGLGGDSIADSDEIDFYAGYGWDLSDTVNLGVGATWYHFPDGGDTFEGYVGLGFDTPLAPAVTAYYDVELEAFTLEGGIGHSVPTGDKTSLDLGAVGGFVTADGPGDYEWITASAALSYAVSDSGSVYAGVNYSLSSEDTLNAQVTRLASGTDVFATTDNDLFWFGVGVAAGF